MTRLLFFLWGAALALPAAAESHALIMTISAYQGGVPPLHGVAHDGESARSIARKMGVKDANMRHYKDGELTLAGMQRAFDELQERIADGDQVFIYFSGHGGRQLVRVPGERCAESLITVDGMGFIDVELESRLKRLASKAQKLVVLLDACHSGGATQRSMGKAAGGAAGAKPAFSAKFYARSGPDACERPINVLTRSLGAASRSAGSGAGNYVYIAAARTSAYNALLDIYNSRDDRRSVSLQSAKSAFRIGKDDVDFSLTSSHAGYAYLLMVGSDGRSFDMLFPNQLDSANAIEAGQTLRLPRPNWQIKAGGPAGKNHLLAIVADSPREFARIGMHPAGPFSMIAASADASRNLQVHAASVGYGAAMVVLEEVD